MRSWPRTGSLALNGSISSAPHGGRSFRRSSTLARSADDKGDRRARATRIFIEYAAAEPELLADLVGDADSRQFAELFPRLALASNRDRAIARLAPPRPPHKTMQRQTATSQAPETWPPDAAHAPRPPCSAWGRRNRCGPRSAPPAIPACRPRRSMPWPSSTPNLARSWPDSATRPTRLPEGDCSWPSATWHRRSPKPCAGRDSFHGSLTCTATSLIRASTARRGASSSPSTRPDPSTRSIVPCPARARPAHDDGSSTRGTS